MTAITRLGLPFTIAFGLLGLTLAAYLADLLVRRRATRLAASALLTAAFTSLVWILAERTIQAGRPPFKTLYESLVLFAACVALVYLAVERFYRLALVGFLSALFLTGLAGYAALRADVDIVALPAALQSAWFIPHVVVYFLGYGALFVATAVAALTLAWPAGRVTFTNLRRQRTVTLSELLYALVKFGFVLITVGLVIGAFWAKSAWGDYWVWDPKENWSLVTWLIYVIFLHLKRLPGFGDRAAAWVAILGFAAVMFTYLGMNALPTAAQSAHAYQ